jgi:hypothetical protein
MIFIKEGTMNGEENNSAAFGFAEYKTAFRFTIKTCQAVFIF